MWINDEVIYTPEKGNAITGVIRTLAYPGTTIEIELPNGKLLKVERNLCEVREDS